MVSHSQYVCADAYLSPLPSSFDAGTSPLALLEKTCLSVGHPDPPGKSAKSILSSDKSTPTKKDGGSQSSPDKSKNSSSPTDKRKDTPGSSSSGKSERASSVGGAKTDENGNKTKPEVAKEFGKNGSRPTSAPTEPGAATSQPIPPSLPSLPTPSRAMPGYPSPYPGMPGFPHSAFPNAYSPHMPFPFSAYSNFSPLAGLGPGLQRPGLPCLDINCKTCPPSPLAGRPCPLGCAQCSVGAHHGAGNDMSAMWLSSYSSLFHGGLPPPPGAMFPNLPSSTSSKLPASLPTSSTASSTNLPHFCSWVTTSGVCYKSFATSDELLQHVKSHTSSDVGAQTSLASSMASSMASMASSMTGLPSPSAMPGGGRMSPRSAYLSALRFNPYGKPHPGLSMGPPPPPFPYSALSALYSGHRLPGSLPHP